MSLYRASDNFVPNKKAFRSEFQCINCPLLACIVEPTRFGSELITGKETDGKTASKWKQARLMLHNRQLSGAVHKPQPKLLQVSRRRRPGGDVKRSWNVRDSSGDRWQSRRKDRAGGRTQRAPPAYLFTNTHTSDMNTHISATWRERLWASCHETSKHHRWQEHFKVIFPSACL